MLFRFPPKKSWVGQKQSVGFKQIQWLCNTLGVLLNAWSTSHVKQHKLQNVMQQLWIHILWNATLCNAVYCLSDPYNLFVCIMYNTVLRNRRWEPAIILVNTEGAWTSYFFLFHFFCTSNKWKYISSLTPQKLFFFCNLMIVYNLIKMQLILFYTKSKKFFLKNGSTTNFPVHTKHKSKM